MDNETTPQLEPGRRDVLRTALMGGAAVAVSAGSISTVLARPAAAMSMDCTATAFFFATAATLAGGEDSFVLPAGCPMSYVIWGSGAAAGAKVEVSRLGGPVVRANGGAGGAGARWAGWIDAADVDRTIALRVPGGYVNTNGLIGTGPAPSPAGTGGKGGDARTGTLNNNIGFGGGGGGGGGAASVHLATEAPGVTSSLLIVAGGGGGGGGGQVSLSDANAQGLRDGGAGGTARVGDSPPLPGPPARSGSDGQAGSPAFPNTDATRALPGGGGIWNPPTGGFRGTNGATGEPGAGSVGNTYAAAGTNFGRGGLGGAGVNNSNVLLLPGGGGGGGGGWAGGGGGAGGRPAAGVNRRAGAGGGAGASYEVGSATTATIAGSPLLNQMIGQGPDRYGDLGRSGTNTHAGGIVDPLSGGILVKLGVAEIISDSAGVVVVGLD